MNDANNMRAIDIARRLAQLGETEKACQAYTLAIHQAKQDNDPETELEGALYILQNGGNYKVAYNSFRDLHKQRFCREDLLSIMTGAFYQPNEKLIRSRYEKNCKLLARYPYLFRKDFLPFEWLPIRFFPYDDTSFLPYHVESEEFGEVASFKHPVITRNFFKDLDKPILASDVYSMYELQYLNDNVRHSEWVARENHIYLHYSSWGEFCAHLQVLNFSALLKDKKIIFLIEEELEQYPIDFKERFGIDYSKFPVKPLGIQEVHRLIWHTQLSTHNGGDFFNEVFDGHPNLILLHSVMMEEIETLIEDVRAQLRGEYMLHPMKSKDGDTSKWPRLLRELSLIRSPSDKDILVFIFMAVADLRPLDPAARISPAVFLQPHFPNIIYSIAVNQRGRAVLDSQEYENVKNSPIFRGFPYIKTFTPMRRPTTSFAATVRFMNNMANEQERRFQTTPWDGEEGLQIISNVVMERILNRSFMIDRNDRLFQDSILVRFEDGKLNPTATFTALAAFLDIPYTESMTYCSMYGEKDYGGGVLVTGFDPVTVYRTYDEFAGVPERIFLEYFMRDVYKFYGYDFHYYDGSPMELERLNKMVTTFDVSDSYARKTWKRYQDKMLWLHNQEDRRTDNTAKVAELGDDFVEYNLRKYYDVRRVAVSILKGGLRFDNKKGVPLLMMPMLELDPDLLEQPLYH